MRLHVRAVFCPLENWMNCPDCHSTVARRESIEIKHAPYIIDYQWLECDGCEERFFGVFTEDKTHMFADDYTYVGYRVTTEAWEATRATPDQCSAPIDPDCSCSIHEMMRTSTRAWKEF